MKDTLAHHSLSNPNVAMTTMGIVDAHSLAIIEVEVFFAIPMLVDVVLIREVVPDLVLPDSCPGYPRQSKRFVHEQYTLGVVCGVLLARQQSAPILRHVIIIRRGRHCRFGEWQLATAEASAGSFTASKMHRANA